LIGLGAFAVPRLFAAGERFLLAAGQTNSTGYLCLSALVLAISILPWCVFMGATFPLMMAYVRECDSKNAASFSFLYLANVLGAMSGTLLTAVVLVELLGFRHTLQVAAAGNFCIAVASAWLAWRQRNVRLAAQPAGERASRPSPTTPGTGSRSGFIKWILFSTGFCAMAMEVVWTRAFAPVLNNQVYSFAMIVFAYLGATFFGSLQYRRDLEKKTVRSTAELIAMLAVAAFLPVVANDPRFVETDHSMEFMSVVIILGSICPLCAILGYLTPKLIDEFAAGNPASAGRAYAINVIGCILGPMIASYVLLPLTSERNAIVILGLPFVAFYFLGFRALSRQRRLGLGLAAGALLVCSLSLSGDFEGQLSKVVKRMEVRRDYAASVISAQGDTPRNKGLFVNGINMTTLTPITKFMVHLPLAFHTDRPESALIICFGMGTSYRSALSWNIETTAVELVPSVKEAFGFYHADAAGVFANPKGRMIIDDGRRYLKRTADKYDVIVIDPPPPVEAAGSSLLYSQEFYELAKQHLKRGGILQAWFPGRETAAAEAVMRSVGDSFPYVRCFLSLEGAGMHILASMEPIEAVNAEAFAARLPESARNDLLEWSPGGEPLPLYIERVLSKEFPPSEFYNPNLQIRITDDQPFNEYFLLRRIGALD
jgi:spermidine synthase